MSQTSFEKVRWTTADLDLLAADEWKRYEIIDGELFVTRAPHLRHQSVILNICAELQDWSDETQLGEVFPTPGIIFSDADNVIPDAIWISIARMERFTDEAGHFTGAPELIIEVLSPGATNERRDREVKLKLYSSQGVEEYWIVSRELQQIEVYRRENAVLKRTTTYKAQDAIISTTLPGFACLVHRFFRQIGITRWARSRESWVFLADRTPDLRHFGFEQEQLGLNGERAMRSLVELALNRMDILKALSDRSSHDPNCRSGLRWYYASSNRASRPESWHASTRCNEAFLRR